MYIVFSCHRCFAILANKTELRQHQIKENHMKKVQRKEEIIYRCDYGVCNQWYTNLHDLGRHKKQHLKPFGCKTCAKRFGAKWDLKIHCRIHNGLKKEKCRYCHKKYTDPSNLRKHIMKHHKSEAVLESFVCRICHKQFKKKESLQRHWKTHTVRRKAFECSVCLKQFTYGYNLNKHMRKYHSFNFRFC